MWIQMTAKYNNSWSVFLTVYLEISLHPTRFKFLIVVLRAPVSDCSIVLVISFQDKSLDLIEYVICVIVSGKVTFSRWENNTVSNYHDFIVEFTKFRKVYQVRYDVMVKISTTSFYCHWDLIFSHGEHRFKEPQVKNQEHKFPCNNNNKLCGEAGFTWHLTKGDKSCSSSDR